MSLHSSRTRCLAAFVGLFVLGGLAVATVVPRDLSKQLELIKANGATDGGVVVYGNVVSAKSIRLASTPDLPWTVLTVHVEQAIAPSTTTGDLTVYFPGFGDERLTISPPEEETRVGENVVLFLSTDPAVRAVDPTAYRIDSFAESFRTQKNRKGEIIVLGEGAGSAIESNVKLADLQPVVLSTYDALVKATKK